MTPQKFDEGGVGVHMMGRLGYEWPIGGWPNMVEVANLTLRHFNEICDPQYGYMSYVGGALGHSKPSFVRSQWNWVEASSYALLGRIAVRRLTGNTSGEEVEIGQRKLTLAAFHNLDGFAHRTYARGWCEDLRVILWEQARVLFTLMAWFMESEDEQLLDYVRGMLKALKGISREEGNQRIFEDRYWRQERTFGDVGPIVLVEPLMKYYALTGDTDALAFCEGIIHWATAPETNLVDERYRFSGWLRGFAAALAAITRYASITGEEQLIRYSEEIFRSARSITTRYGGTPDTEPCCTNMELTTAALALARAGHTEYWDDVDRWFRNHTLECQFRESSRIKSGCVDGCPNPADDTRDILNRSVGGFSWATSRERLVRGKALMLCCGGNAMWTMGKIIANTVVKESSGLTINLHFSVDTPMVSITNHEPFEGRLEIVPRISGRVRIRKPAFVGAIDSAVDGAPVRPGVLGDYLVFDGVNRNGRITLTYALPERITEETTRNTPYEGHHHHATFQPTKFDPVVKERIWATWRGNTLLAVDDDEESENPCEHRLYLNRMKEYRRSTGRGASERFFLPDKAFEW